MVANADDEALETVATHEVEEIHDATVVPEDAAEVTGTEIHEVEEIHAVRVIPEDAAEEMGTETREVAAVRGGQVVREAQVVREPLVVREALEVREALVVREALEALEDQDAPEGRAGDRNEEPLKRFLLQLRNSAIHHSLVFHRSSWLHSSQTNRKSFCGLLLSNLDANPLTVSQKFHRHQIS